MERKEEKLVKDLRSVLAIDYFGGFDPDDEES